MILGPNFVFHLVLEVLEPKLHYTVDDTEQPSNAGFLPIIPSTVSHVPGMNHFPFFPKLCSHCLGP